MMWSETQSAWVDHWTSRECAGGKGGYSVLPSGIFSLYYKVFIYLTG